jgi:O-succinylbenzoate synthase
MGIPPVERLTLREIALPLREPFVTAGGTTEVRRIMLLHLQAVDGCEAWSECVAGTFPTYTSEAIDTAWVAIDHWFADRVLGREFTQLADAGRFLGLGARGHQMARAALEMGLWALEATRRGISLSQLLGGTRQVVGTGISLGLRRDASELLERCLEAVDLGYRRIKLKIAPGWDLEPLRKVCYALGDSVAIAADANSAYTLADAVHLAKLDELRLSMLEQPLGWDDLVRHADLQRRLRTPICLDESLDSLDRVEDMFRLRAAEIVNLKPGRVGGLAVAKAIHDFCQQKSIGLWCGGMLETGIGRAYNVALASLPHFTLPGDLSPSARYWLHDIVEPAWTMSMEGEVAVPMTPGLGVRVDEERIEALTVRMRTLEA